MFRFTISLLLSVLAIHSLASVSMKYDDTHIIFEDDDTHLYYLLNIETKEAKLGIGNSDDKNAVYYPPLGDDWWTDTPNLWGDLVIPGTIECDGEVYTVNEVASKAFYKFTSVRTIKLPETIKEIGPSAFGFCTYLKEINIPEGVTNIGSQAFYCCKSLTSLKLPSTLEKIESGTFMDCVLITSINIPGKCSSIDDDAFSWCIALDTLIIEDGDTPLQMGYAYEFGPMWEAGCAPYYYQKRFSRGLFNDCPLKNLYIGRNIEYDDKIWSIMSPFEHCYAKYDAYNNSSYQRSGNYYDKVSFGNKVTEIHSKLFKGSHIPEIILPNSVEFIHEEAFSDAINQSNLILPESCKSIGENAFKPLNNYGPLRFIECKSDVPPVTHQTAFTGSYTTQYIMISVPSGKRSTYKADSFWSKLFICDPSDELIDINVKYANSLYGRLAQLDKQPSDVYRLKLSGELGSDDWETINSMSLYELDLSEVYCEDLSVIKSVFPRMVTFKFPKGVKTIQSDLFSGTHLQGEIRIPEECEHIERSAFSGKSISKVIITGPTVIEEMAFSHCKNLSEVSISGGAIIKEDAFRWVFDVDNPNAGLETLILGDGVIVCSNAFYWCTHLQNIIINGRVASIEDNAFNYCENIKKMTFTGSIAKIGTGAYTVNSDRYTEMALDELHINNIKEWCNNSFSLGANPIGYSKKTFINGKESCSIDIPNDVKRINNFVFSGCKVLTEVNIVGENIEIGSSAFSGCSNLRAINIPDGTTSIGSSAFSGCSSLNSITLPSSLEALSQYLFYGCSSLEAINIPNDIINIPSYVFYGCEKLNGLSIPSSVTNIEEYAFYGCSSLDNVVLPSNCKTIREAAFNGCSSLSEIAIPLSCITIGDAAFANCSSLTELRLPQHLSSIGSGAFEGCSSLKRIQALWTVAPEINTSTFNSINNKCILYVPVGSVQSYYANGWGRVPLIEEGFCVINLKNNLYGAVKYMDKVYTENNDMLVVDIDSDVTIEVVPNENFYVKSLILNDASIIPDLHSTTMTMNEVTGNHILYVDYGKYVLGDVNDDDYVDVGDITQTVNYIMHKENNTFIPAAADTNVDNDIDVGDIRGIVNIIHDIADMGYNNHYRAMSIDEPCQIDVEYSPTDNQQEYLLNVILSNTTEVSGFQITMTLPKGVSIPIGENNVPFVRFDSDRTSMMNIKEVTQLNDSCYILMCTTTKPVNLECGKGAIMSVKLQLSDVDYNASYKIQLSDIRIADNNANVYHSILTSNMIPYQIITNISETKTKYNKDIQKYVENGRIIIRDHKDIYNINGLKIN